MTARPNRGFALLMTLALVALLAIALSGLTRQSLRIAGEATDARRQLQHRWTTASCRWTLLHQADTIFATPEPDDAVSVERRAQLSLNGKTYLVILTDEQAKANLNVLLADASGDDAKDLVDDLLPDDLPDDVTIALRGVDSEADRDADVSEENDGGNDDERRDLPQRNAGGAAQLGSYAQVFEGVNLHLLFAVPGRDGGADNETPAPLANAFTLWGDGRLNVRRSSAEALSVVMREHLNESEARDVVRARHDQPDAGLTDWLSAVELPEGTLKAAAEKLTDKSSCIGVFVAAVDDPSLDTRFTVLTRPDAKGKNKDNNENESNNENENETETESPGERPDGKPQPMIVYRLIWQGVHP